MSGTLATAFLSQHARLITLQLPQATGADNPSVVVERLSGNEALNECFSFALDVLATSSDFQPFEVAIPAAAAAPVGSTT